MNCDVSPKGHVYKGQNNWVIIISRHCSLSKPIMRDTFHIRDN